MRTNAKATPINDNDYSRHITAVELVYQSYEVYITPHHATSYSVLIASGMDTHTHAYRQSAQDQF